MITIFFFIIYIVFNIYLANNKPTLFVIYYMLISTKMLGFFSVDDIFIFDGFALGFFSINFITLMITLSKKNKTKKSFRHLIFKYVFVFLMIFGIFYPILQGNSSLLSSLVASKEFWTFSFFIYISGNSKKLNIDRILKVIMFLGIYLSLIFIIYQIINIAPPYYVENKINIGEYLRTYYPTYISLAIFISVYFNYKNSHFLNHYVTILILFFGIFLSGYFALFIGTLISYVLLIVISDYKQSLFYLLFKLSLSIIFIFLFMVTYNKNIENFNKKIYLEANNSVISRNNYNEFRWDAFDKQPLLGYGFLKKYKQSKRFSVKSDNVYNESLGFIDSGYLDLLIKFGYIGALIYLFFWAIIILPPIFKIKKS
jgi:hypothetical protein